MVVWGEYLAYAVIEYVLSRFIDALKIGTIQFEAVAVDCTCQILLFIIVWDLRVIYIPRHMDDICITISAMNI